MNISPYCEKKSIQGTAKVMHKVIHSEQIPLFNQKHSANFTLAFCKLNIPQNKIRGHPQTTL